MTVFAKFTKSCAVTLALLASQFIACHAAEEEIENDNIELRHHTSTTVEESKTNGESWFFSSASSIYLRRDDVAETFTEMRNRFNECCSATYNCFAETVKNPHFWVHVVGTGMVVTGSAMMGTADITLQEYETTCTDDDKYYDDDCYGDDCHTHYHPNTHRCTKTECVGPDCGQYYGGMALLIGGVVIIGLDWVILCGCDCSGGGRQRTRNTRWDPHHSR